MCVSITLSVSFINKADEVLLKKGGGDMENHIDQASYLEMASFYCDDIVAYVNALIECGDYVTLSSAKKPSLSDYDAYEG